MMSFYTIIRREYLTIFTILAVIGKLIDKINVAEWFRAKSPSLTGCKEGDLPLLSFSNLTCMHKPRKKTLIPYIYNASNEGPFLKFSEKNYKFKIPTVTGS